MTHMRQAAPSRRGFIVGGSAAMAALAACQSTVGTPAPAPTRNLDRIGIQTYTLREAFAEDFVGTFEMIKAVGYDYVELNSRNLTDHTADELRRILDDVG